MHACSTCTSPFPCLYHSSLLFPRKLAGFVLSPLFSVRYKMRSDFRTLPSPPLSPSRVLSAPVPLTPHPTSVTWLVETKSSTLAPPELHSTPYPLATSNIPSWTRFPRSSLMRSSTTSHVTASILLPASRSGGGEGANNVYSVQSHSALKA